MVITTIVTMGILLGGTFYQNAKRVCGNRVAIVESIQSLAGTNTVHVVYKCIHKPTDATNGGRN